MKKLLIATHNPGKLAEFKNFLSDLPLKLISLTEIGITDDIEEDGKTYEENSKKKALFFAKKSGLPALADDGGIEIDALNGEPGVRSRRWLGHHATDEELISHMQKISRRLSKDNRKAKFRTVITVAFPNGTVRSQEGSVDGIIAKKPALNRAKGYPYRSFFFLPQLHKFYFESELTDAENKRYNHRYLAVAKLKPYLQRLLGLENT
ncbi:MAG TPA: non-canonical purine NTP pyrophosphatase [Patescibacteria group bacterium]|nr:non-canonical purine NTP pyrophosphatase [Patescibacteria group bacterium]